VPLIVQSSRERESIERCRCTYASEQVWKIVWVAPKQSVGGRRSLSLSLSLSLCLSVCLSLSLSLSLSVCVCVCDSLWVAVGLLAACSQVVFAMLSVEEVEAIDQQLTRQRQRKVQ
jgi:hypothetical protein